MKKKIAILGSTGSIGQQSLQVIAEHPDLFEAEILTANNQVELLISQARQFMPDTVVIGNEQHYERLCQALQDLPIKVFCGYKAISQVAENATTDIVLTALVGFAGLEPTIHAIKAGKTIALANKETLVVAGEIVGRLAQEHRTPILPVDSEHSAIFQCLAGEGNAEIEKILLTASGGPFRNFTKEQMENVTAAQALKHPNWKMGAKITIDSATMMNKGFEMIEARWLFGVSPHQIEILVHPQSVIHSAVEFKDGSVKAQLGVPDMRLPIQYALSYPSRLTLKGERLDLCQLGKLTFEHPDMEAFPCLEAAYKAINEGGNMPCVLNAANEIANHAFRMGNIGFNDIHRLINMVMKQIPYEKNLTFDVCIQTDKEARKLTTQLIQKK